VSVSLTLEVLFTRVMTEIVKPYKCCVVKNNLSQHQSIRAENKQTTLTANDSVKWITQNKQEIQTVELV